MHARPRWAWRYARLGLDHMRMIADWSPSIAPVPINETNLADTVLEVDGS